MNTQFKPLAVITTIMGLMVMVIPTMSVMANDAPNAQVETLEKQMANLQKEITALKKQMSNKHIHRKKLKVHTHTDGGDSSSVDSAGEDDYFARRPLRGKDLLRMIEEEKEYLPFDLDVPGQAFVSTGPYVGVPLQYSGSNLVVNSPSVNTDVQLLSIRKSIHQQLMAMGGEIFKEPYHSHLLLSGVVEGQANYINNGGSPSTTNINVTNVSLDAFFLGPSDWILGFVEFSYDNTPPIYNGVFDSASYYTTSNSRVFVNKAFVTAGDFSKTPFYGSFGQFYVPFGTYSSLMITTPFTTILTRTKARSFLLGAQQQEDNGFYGAAYIFRGDSHAASVSKVNNGGVNLGYKYKCGVLNGNFGGGVIGNIADSGGMQVGNGFNNNEQLVHRVPGYNLRGIFGIGDHIDLIAEFVGATMEFSPNNMSFNGHGAKPWALDTEAAYTFPILNDRPSTLAVGYQKSNQALSIGLPLTRYSLVFATSLLRNTLQSMEFRHDRNYAGSDVGNGPINGATGACTAATCTATGKGDNAFTVSFDYYF